MLDHLLRYGRTLGLSLTLVMLIASGCSDFNNPLAPTGPETAIESAADQNDGPAVLTKKKKSSSTETASTASQAEPQSAPPSQGRIVYSQWISAENGGYMSVKTDDGSFKYNLTFRPGSLSEDTKITMIVPDPTRAEVELEPHGIQFNKSVTFKMEIYTEKVASLNPPGEKNKLGIYHYNEDSHEWELQRSQNEVERKKKKIKSETEIFHFSRWALGGDSPIQKWYYQSYYYGY